MGMLSSAWCSPGPSIGSASSPALIPDRDTGPHGQWRLIPSWGRKSWLDNWHWVPPRELQVLGLLRLHRHKQMAVLIFMCAGWSGHTDTA